MTHAQREHIIALNSTKLVYYLIKGGRDRILNHEVLEFVLSLGPKSSISVGGIDNVSLVQIVFLMMVNLNQPESSIRQSQIIDTLRLLHTYGYDIGVAFEDTGSIAVEYNDIRTTGMYYTDNPTILYHAIEIDMAKVAKFVAGLGYVDNEQDEKGNTALHLAMYYDMDEVVELLVANGSDLEIENYSGQSPRSISNEGFCSKAVKDAFNRGLTKRSR